MVATVLVSLHVPAALADSGATVPVRVGTHESYGRVVFNLPMRTDYQVTQQGQHVIIQFTGTVTLGPPNAVPRNVIAIAGTGNQEDITVAPGASVRDWRFGNVVVLDVMDPGAAADPAAIPKQGAPSTPATPPASPPAPAGASSAPIAPPVPEPAVAAAPSQPALTVPPPPPAPSPPASPPASATALPAATPPAPEGRQAAASVIPDQPLPSGPAAPPSPSNSAAPPAPATAMADASGQTASNSDEGLVIQGDAQLGVAAFRRGNAALIVFDERRAVDTAALRDDPVFGTATILALPAATVIRVQLDDGMSLSLSRTADVWRITSASRETATRPVQSTVAEDRLVVAAAAPGSVVSVADPETGGTLLVGTQRSDGQGVAMPRRSPDFTLLPTWQGVAVEAHADTVVLRPTPEGFVVVGAPNLSPPSGTAEQLTHAAALTRQFDFPSRPPATLLEQLRRNLAESASAPPLARGPYREAVARTMIALGLGAEAGVVLRVAAADDPRQADAADSAALLAIAALLAHRPEEAEGLADRRLPDTDDIALWRAVHLAELDETSAQAAAALAATLPLLLAYPPEMRDRILPLAAENLVSGGQPEAAAALLDARKEDEALDLARAMLLEAQGKSAEALASYDRLAQSSDQFVHARAASRAVELRLASGAINTKQAAEALEGLLYSWRGDHHERALRERLAELKVKTGAWREALALLRDGETLFPDDKDAIHAKLSDLFATLLRGDTADTLAPLELVAVVEENADLLPSGSDGDVLQGKLADRLLALDLPKRAGPVLEKLMQAANSGPARAGFGARLAALRLREDDAAGALAALDGSVAPDLPADLVERRTLLAAAASARRGDNERALAVLGTLDSPAADEARATILERTNDWSGAQKTLSAYAARTVPAEGKLDDVQRRTLLRLATAAARAGDDATLAALRQQDGARMETGPLADMFRLLTADQVRGIADLRRSGQEAVLARDLPGQLRALQPPVQPTQ